MKKNYAFMLLILVCLTKAIEADPVTTLPLVGILAQYGSTSMDKQYPAPPLYYTYVAGSYVDWTSLAGAMPVLIPFDTPRANLDFLLGYVDAILIPGGVTPLGDGQGGFSDFQQTINYILDKAKQFNDGGRYFPVWGTCNGFEALMVYWAQNSNVLTCEFNDIYRDHPIDVDPAIFPNSKFWGALNQDRLKRVFQNGYVFYDHSCGVNPVSFSKFNLKDKVWLLATSKTDANVTFIAIAEDIKYPFFAVQWHPEKTQFERGSKYSFLDKSTDTIRFLSEIIQELVDRVRLTARPLSQIPVSIQPYFSIYQTPIVTNYNGFERVYQIPRLVRNLTLVEDNKPLDKSELYTGTNGDLRGVDEPQASEL